MNYNDRIHRLGRWGVGLTLGMLLIIPIVFGLFIGSMPTLSDFFIAFVGVAIIFVPIGIAETVSFTPILGNGSYIAFITGNIMNIKIPLAQNAQAMMGTDKGTPQNDVITTLAISVSALVTMLILAIGVLLLEPLRPIMTSAPVQTASQYVLPALFGALVVGLLKGSGSIRVQGKLKAGLLPLAVLLIVNLLVINTYDFSGPLLIVMIPIVIGLSYVLYQKGMIKVVRIDPK